MLKKAVSEAPGGEPGLGVMATIDVDQTVLSFQVVPVPSQKMFAADTTSGESTDAMANASQQAQIFRRTMNMGRPVEKHVG
jgi:hypothetical protein